MWVWSYWVIIRRRRIVVFGDDLLKFLHRFFKTSTISCSVRRPRARLGRLIMCSASITWFGRRNSDIWFDDYSSSSVFDWVKNKLPVFMIDEDEFVNLVSKNINFLIDEGSQLGMASAEGFVLGFSKSTEVFCRQLEERRLRFWCRRAPSKSVLERSLISREFVQEDLTDEARKLLINNYTHRGEV